MEALKWCRNSTNKAFSLGDTATQLMYVPVTAHIHFPGRWIGRGGLTNGLHEVPTLFRVICFWDWAKEEVYRSKSRNELIQDYFAAIITDVLRKSVQSVFRVPELCAKL